MKMEDENLLHERPEGLNKSLKEYKGKERIFWEIYEEILLFLVFSLPFPLLLLKK